MTATIAILWKEGDAAGYSDLIPLTWFKPKGLQSGRIHYVIGPRQGYYIAKCNIIVSTRHAKLDYTAFPSFNTTQSMELGVMRINFKNEKRQEATACYWNEQNDGNFQRCAVKFFTWNGPNGSPDNEAATAALEGDKLLVAHLNRERNLGIVRRKKQSVLISHGRLACEACDFNFEDKYGELGARFAEVHHISSIASGSRVTKLSDLAILCANCHRMIHLTDPMLTVKEFRSKHVNKRFLDERWHIPLKTRSSINGRG